jgi:hypothetical protein
MNLYGALLFYPVPQPSLITFVGRVIKGRLMGT